MPTYDYICDACGEKMEIFHKITDDPIKKCPVCKKNKLVRQFGTGAAIVFKGSGFYQTDYRSDNYRKSAESERKSAESGSGGEGGSKDSGSKESGKNESGAKKEPATESKKPASDSSSPPPKEKPGKSDKSDK